MIFILFLLSSVQLLAEEPEKWPPAAVCDSISNMHYKENCHNDIKGRHIDEFATAICTTISDDYLKRLSES